MVVEFWEFTEFCVQKKNSLRTLTFTFIEKIWFLKNLFSQEAIEESKPKTYFVRKRCVNIRFLCVCCYCVWMPNRILAYLENQWIYELPNCYNSSCNNSLSLKSIHISVCRSMPSGSLESSAWRMCEFFVCVCIVNKRDYSIDERRSRKEIIKQKWCEIFFLFAKDSWYFHH